MTTFIDYQQRCADQRHHAIDVTNNEDAALIRTLVHSHADVTDLDDTLVAALPALRRLRLRTLSGLCGHINGELLHTNDTIQMVAQVCPHQRPPRILNERQFAQLREVITSLRADIAAAHDASLHLTQTSYTLNQFTPSLL